MNAASSAKGGARVLGLLRQSWFTVAIGAIAVCFAIGALGYSGDAQKFPLVVGVLTAILAAAELVLAGLGRSAVRADGGDAAGGSVKSFMLAVWFTATVAGLYMLGLLIAAFCSTAVYFFIFVDRKPVWAVAFGVAHCAFIWLAFDVLAGFRLYQGWVW